jgi:hypothetical protein
MEANLIHEHPHQHATVVHAHAHEVDAHHGEEVTQSTASG